MSDPLIEVRDDPDEGAYVVEVDGESAGEAVYRVRGGSHLFVHTEVDEKFAGMGVGTRLVQEALDDVRAQGGSVVPICPFFAAYIRRHPEYEDLIDQRLYQRVKKTRQGESDIDG